MSPEAASQQKPGTQTKRAAKSPLPLSGIVPPMVTPLTDRDTLDIPGVERLMSRMVDGGVSGIFVLGTTGEGPSLSYRLRRELIEIVCRLASKRLPVLVGISDTSFVESVNLGRFSAEHGAHAVVIAPPYYLPEGQPELLEYYQHIVAELPLPVFLYNMPSLTKVSLDPATVRTLMHEKRIVGLKDSSGSMTYFHRLVQLLEHRPDWSLLAGPEELLFDSVLAGGHGGVNGGANMFPSLYVALFEAARRGDLSHGCALHSLVMRVSTLIYGVGRHPSATIKGIKCALSCMGICNDFMAEPFHRFRAEQREQISRALVEIEAALNSLGLGK